MLRFSGTGLLGHLHIAELAAVDAAAVHAVGLNREGLPGILARTKAHAGEVVILSFAPALVFRKLRVELLGLTDRAAGIEDSSNQHLARCIPVPGRKGRQDEVSDLRLHCRWSILCSQQLHGLVVGVPRSTEPAAQLSSLACARVEPYLARFPCGIAAVR